MEMTSYQHAVSRNIYAVVLKKGEPSPVDPESDDEKIAPAKSDEKSKNEQKDASKAKETDKKEEKKDEKKDEPVTVTIDLEGIGQRIVSLPIKAANYVSLTPGKPGVLYLAETAVIAPQGPPQLTVSKFDLSSRKTEAFLNGVNGYAISANGEKVFYRLGPTGWFIAATAAAPTPGEGALKPEELEVYVDPRAEWNQMYHEVWRIQRDFFYDPHWHGLDLTTAEKQYAPFVKAAGARDDINHLCEEMLGEITVGHMFVGGGDFPKAPEVKGGLR